MDNATIAPKAHPAGLNFREHLDEIKALPEARHLIGNTYECPACHQSFTVVPERFVLGFHPAKCPHCGALSRR